MCAVFRGNYQIIKLLLEKGANKYAMDDFGRTPYSIAKGDTRIIRLLNGKEDSWCDSCNIL